MPGSSRAALVLAALSAASCASATTPPDRDSNAAAGHATARATTRPRPSTPVTEAAGERPIELRFVDVGSVPFEVTPIAGTLVGTTSYSQADDPYQRTFKLFVLKGNRFEKVWQHHRGPFEWVGPTAVYGTADGAIDVVGMRPGARSSDPVLDSIPKNTSKTSGYGSWVGVASRDGSTYGINVSFGFARMDTLRGGPDLSQQPAPPGCHGEGAENYPHVIAESLVATRDGALVAAGTQCNGGFALEIWKRGAGTSEILVPPGGGQQETAKGMHFHAEPASDGFLFGADLQRLEAGKLVRVEPQPPVPVRSAFEAPDGRLMAVASVTLHRGAVEERLYVLDGGAWRRALLPSGEPVSGALFDGKTVWSVTKDGSWLKLVTDGSTPERFTFDAKELPREEPVATRQAADELPKRPTYKPGGPTCERNVVVLYGFTKVTPDDYDFPLTRKAIKGHQRELAGVEFAVTRDAGKKYFVGLAPTFATAKKLQAVIEKGVPGSKPQVVCAEPEILRKLDIDLATGELAR